MRTVRPLALLSLLGCALLPEGPLLANGDTPASTKAAAPTSAKIAAPVSAHGTNVFSLLPRSFQDNPRTDLSVICEMTDEGRKRPVVTADFPATYLAHDAGFLEAGEVDSVRKPDQAALIKTLERALAQNGYKPVAEGGRPDYALIYHWGTHRRNTQDEFLDELIGRALLVGGRKFAQELRDVLVEQAEFYRMTPQEARSGMPNMATEQMAQAIGTNSIDPGLSSAAGTNPINSAMGLLNVLSPLEKYKRKDPRNEFLVEQTLGSIYFVVITAIDPVLAAQGRKVVLWRARMSVDSNGLALSDALPAMLSHSSPFLGRDMDAAATMTPKLLRGKDKISIGEATVVEDEKASKEKKKK